VQKVDFSTSSPLTLGSFYWFGLATDIYRRGGFVWPSLIYPLKTPRILMDERSRLDGLVSREFFGHFLMEGWRLVRRGKMIWNSFSQRREAGKKEENEDKEN
jgi:hypothetical protein